MHDFLDLIESGLLIVESRKLEQYRFTSVQVCSALGEIQKKLEIDEAYGLEPKPWGPAGRPGIRVSTSEPVIGLAPAHNISPSQLSKRSTF